MDAVASALGASHQVFRCICKPQYYGSRCDKLFRGASVNRRSTSWKNSGRTMKPEPSLYTVFSGMESMVGGKRQLTTRNLAPHSRDPQPRRRHGAIDLEAAQISNLRSLGPGKCDSGVSIQTMGNKGTGVLVCMSRKSLFRPPEQSSIPYADTLRQRFN
ncbi:unnamed protein product [Dicrocoelium dendriticum]|nr:unnamed protein product [Dicrocoelium dendriticum]